RHTSSTRDWSSDVCSSDLASAGQSHAPAVPAGDLNAGLLIIETRTQSLARFMNAYARLARLPKPVLSPLDAGAWVRRVASLETRVPVEVTGTGTVTLSADSDQLEQLLTNLGRHAADAALETRGRVVPE